MRTIFILSIIASMIAFASCNTPTIPKVVYDDTKSDTLTIKNVLEDTTKVLVTGMPVYLDSTEVLIHPIGWEDIYSTNYDFRIKSSATKRVEKSTYSFGVSSNDEDYISGDMVNLIFEDLATSKQAILTDKVMIIKHVRYLKDVAKKIGKHYLFYTVYDKDYNRDGKLDLQDLVAYYMSNLDGSNFIKITHDYHFLDDSKILLKNDKYYFRTLEDVDKNGEFNKKDKYHYYYINLKDGDFTPIEYFPLELMNIQ